MRKCIHVREIEVTERKHKEVTLWSVRALGRIANWKKGKTEMPMFWFWQVNNAICPRFIKLQTIETVNTREHSQPAYGAAERKLVYEFVFVGIVKNAKLQLF